MKGVSQLNVRVSGKRFDVHAHVLLDTDLSAKDTHRIAFNVERAVKDEFPTARVTIDTEPFGISRENIWRSLKDVAEGTPGSRGVHNIHIQKIDGKLFVDLHLEVSANMTVKQAHVVADEVEDKIRSAEPDISGVTVHIESASDRVSRELTGVETELKSGIEHIAENFPEIKGVSGVRVRKAGKEVHVALTCRFEANLEIEKAHEVSSRLEKAIRSVYPQITRIDVHEEPA